MKIKLLVSSISFLAFFNTALLGQQRAPSIIWQKCFGGTKSESANSIVKSGDGAYIIAGTSYSNDGDVTGHHGSTDSADAWIIKVSASGSLIWQKTYGGSGNDIINYMTSTNDGGFIALGTTTSNDGDVSGYHGGGDIWILKLDANGNLQWQKCLGGSGLEAFYGGVGINRRSNNIAQTTDGGYILAGFTGSNDGDVTGNPSLYSPMWIVKLSYTGAVQWQKNYDGNVNCIFPIGSDRYAVGLNSGNVGTPQFPATINQPNSFLAILNSTGDLVDTKTFSLNGFNLSWHSTGPANLVKANGNNYFLVSSDIPCPTVNPGDAAVSVNRCDSSFSILARDEFLVPGCSYVPDKPVYGNNIAVLTNESGIFAGSSSNLPGPSNYHGDNTTDTYDGYLSNFAPHEWERCYGGTGNDLFNDLVAEDDFTYIAAGSTDSNDGDVSGNKGGFDFWIVKLGNTNVIRGTVFADYNSNGIKESNEPFVNGIVVQSKKGESSISGSVYNGLYSNSVDTGSYITSVLTGNPYYKAVPASHSSVFGSYNNSDSISFAIQPIPGKRDYRTYMEGGNASAYSLASTDLDYRISYYNEGTDTLVNKNIKLIYDSNVTFLSADVTPSSINGDTITWTIASLSPEKIGGFGLTMHFKIAAGKTIADYLGDTLVSKVIIDTTGDLNTSNNTFILRQPILSSFDPNDKQESNAGYILSSDVSNGKYLQYTINFQNTGTDTAYNIVITDSLGTKLDWSSIEMVNASSAYKFSIANGNKCTWTFTNIKLPDSLQNEQASHGFVTYRIKPVNNVVKGDSILNKASIIFDYNLPVETNAQTTIVKGSPVQPLPTPIISGPDSVYCNNVTSLKIRIVNFPASFYQATVTAQLDGMNVTIGTDSSFSIDPSLLSAGPHQVKVVFSNSINTTTTINNFKIILPVTPQLSLNASTTVVTATTMDVIITATNVSGGGDSPQYSFASDKLFNNIVQQNSTNNTLTVQATSLSTGDNWIYARMMTSDTCYTTQTATDSIKITRNDVVSGLIDPDFPNRVINIYPNPFKYQFTISGLQSSKTYTVALYTAEGRQLLSQKILNQQQWQASGIFVAAGVYTLRLYDATKNKVIGIVKIVEAR